MQDFVEYVAKGLVDQPEEVVVSETTAADGRRVIELRVAPDDRGKVIGKKGRTAHAVRTLLAAATDDSTTLDILD